MTFGSDMQQLAVELTSEFAGELGLSTLYHFTGETYNTTTGLNVKTWTEHEAYMAIGDIKEGSISGVPFEYYMNHKVITVAGSSLSVVPEQGDIVNLAGTTEGMEVVSIDTDMYGAAFKMYIMLKPVALPVVVIP